MHIIKDGYQVATPLFDLVNNEILPGLEINKDNFWDSLADIFQEFIPVNQALLATRVELQQQIDQWHKAHNTETFDPKAYQAFLSDIDYLVAEQNDFTVETKNVDSEVAQIAGPQLVVPLMNARYALNAANARWGSLYDALYGTDAIDSDNGSEISKAYNPVRGKKVVEFARDFLDQNFALAGGSHKNATCYYIDKGRLTIILSTGEQTYLQDESLFCGYNGDAASPSAILLCHHGLHVEIQIDKTHLIGKTDPAFIKDIVLESALSTIQDCEDSIAAVDAEDKTLVYRNWLGLMKGDLTETLEKNGKKLTRSLNPDRSYINPEGEKITLSGRSLQFIRNVGHLMTTNTVLTPEGQEVPEGILDGVITSLISLHDLKTTSTIKNSQAGSIYIVKPKMHGPKEVEFTNDLFSRIETHLNLALNTIKIGIMDEERRTSVNLKECIRAVKSRVAFINTGFLDRTGDEIHTSMLAGPMVPKELMKDEKWISAYEERNVAIGLQVGLKGKAQIGKGMWAVPDQMANMLKTKMAHPSAGANCAWVPSPTAATLHALHYHQINVANVQGDILAQSNTDHSKSLTELLTIPLLSDKSSLTEQQIQDELDNNIQGLLGYVVRWVDQGIGCSKVPDIHNVGRMEDRATLRISSQHICNWLHHNILTKEQVDQSLRRMAKIVDQQNAADKTYQNMAPDYENNIAFKAASDLIFKGEMQPSGYTEPLLHQSRKRLKAGNN